LILLNHNKVIEFRYLGISIAQQNAGKVKQ